MKQWCDRQRKQWDSTEETWGNTHTQQNSVIQLEHNKQQISVVRVNWAGKTRSVNYCTSPKAEEGGSHQYGDCTKNQTTGGGAIWNVLYAYGMPMDFVHQQKS